MFVAFFDKDRLHDYLRIARTIRAAGIGEELYPEPRKLGAQLKYADQRGFRIALIAGSQELDAGEVQIKNLATKVSTTVPWRETPEAFVASLSNMMRLPDLMA